MEGSNSGFLKIRVAKVPVFVSFHGNHINLSPCQTCLTLFKSTFHGMTFVLGLIWDWTAGRINMPITATVKISMSSFFIIYAFQVGLFYISVFPPFLAYACHVSEVCGRTTVVVFGYKASWQILYTCQTVRRWKTVRHDKMFILKAFTPLQAPDSLTLAQIDS